MAIPKKILVPVDFSSSSLAALDTAIELAARFGATFELLHAWEPPPVYGTEALVAGGAALYAELDDSTRRAAGKDMAELVERLQKRGFRDVRAHIERGAPSLVILEMAAKNGYDMIVMGTHGRRGFSRFLAGSVAEKVVRLAHVPVLTIRHPDGAGAVSFA